VNIDPLALDLLTLKQGILLLWAVWMTLVVILNVFDAFKVAKLLPDTWKFASGNHWYIAEVTKIYGTPAWANIVLLWGAILWEALCATLLWMALATFNGSSYALINAAFVVGLALWAMFMLLDEIFLAWSVAIGNSNPMEAHRSTFTTWLVCLMAINLLPNA
jgi:hypothetical protein